MQRDGNASPDLEPGEAYDCDACGGTHVVEESKGLRVAGTTGGLDPTRYVRCPEAGVVPLTDAAGDRADAGADEAGADDEERDWP